MNADMSGNFFIRSGQLRNDGKKLHGLGRKIKINQVLDTNYFNDEKSFVVEGQF